MKYNQAPSQFIPSRMNATRTQRPEPRLRAVACKRCSSDNLRSFKAEMNIHFAGYGGLTKPTVWVFPEVMACLDCGFADFSIPEPELRRLAEDDLGTVRSPAA